jgi:hypothetical protein
MQLRIGVQTKMAIAAGAIPMGKVVMSIIYDDHEVTQMIDRTSLYLRRRLSKTIHMSCRERLRRKVAARFDTEGDAASGKWVPLAESTIERRIAEGFSSGPINVRTGGLREWSTEEAEPRVVGSGGELIVRYPGTVPHDEERTWWKVWNAQEHGREIFAANEGDLEEILLDINVDLEVFVKVGIV